MVSSIQAVYTIAFSIKNWLDAQGLEEKETVIRSISSIVDRIQEALTPFIHTEDTSEQNQKIELDSNLDSAFNGMRDVLTRTKEHLIAWKRKKPNLKGFSGLLIFFGPGQVLNALRQDEAGLNHQMIPMLLSVNHLLREKSTSLVPVSGESPSLARSGGVDDHVDGGDRDIVTSGQISEVDQFWRDYIGLKIHWAPKDIFHHSLSRYLCYSLPDEAYHRMILALDEYNLGGVTPNTLSRLVNEFGSLKDLVDTFEDYDSDADSIVTLVNPSVLERTRIRGIELGDEVDTVLGDPTPSLPLLLWIDDNPENVIHSMRYAQSIGVHVVSITSTHDAKEWIDKNLVFLKANNKGSRIRVISDNARIEFDPSTLPATDTAAPSECHEILPTPSSGSHYNFSAGESIIRYMRGHLLTRIPILICCGGSIPYTRYVEEYALCGSTVSMRIAEEYVRALMEGRVDDVGWRGYDAGWDPDF